MGCCNHPAKWFLVMALLLPISACISYSGNTSESLDELTMPEGFKIEIYAEDVPNARSLALSPSGILYVGSRQAGNVYAVTDENGDYKADRVNVIASGLRMPNGVAYRNGALYVAAVNRILRYDDIEADLNNIPDPVVVTDRYPSDGHHGWKYIDFGPDGKLYVPVGAPCNICNPDDEIYATITRINPDGSGREVIARGVRNTVGFDWHPQTGDLWFSDNGRDWMGDNRPPDELNHLTQEGQHFGYPFLHGKDIWDPEFGARGRSLDINFKTPAQLLGPHVASLGILFYSGSMFPEHYRNQIFIAEHGSWNRREKIGYRITLVTLDGQHKPISYEPFIEGWLRDDQSVWGQPVEFEQLDDGSVLISDDYSGTIYRLSYKTDPQ